MKNFFIVLALVVFAFPYFYETPYQDKYLSFWLGVFISWICIFISKPITKYLLEVKNKES